MDFMSILCPETSTEQGTSSRGAPKPCGVASTWPRFANDTATRQDTKKQAVLPDDCDTKSDATTLPNGATTADYPIDPVWSAAALGPSSCTDFDVDTEASVKLMACQGCHHMTPASRYKKPFHKWMKTLQKRAAACRHGVTSSDGDAAQDTMSWDGAHDSPAYRRRSSSNSSLAFVTTAKTASISLMGTSLMTRSRRTTLLSSRGPSRTDRSSRASVSGARLSEDSTCIDRSSILDPVVTERSLQRRRVLEELISTEESYIGDVRFLIHVYINILASLPTLPAGLRSSINRNLTEIVEMHDEILGELHSVVPYSEYTQLHVPSKALGSNPHGHRRWRSLGTVPEDKNSMAWLRDVPGMTTDPQIAAEVARIFSSKMNQFFIYEEYGAKYELMIKDVAAAHRTLPQWDSYQKGLEALAASLSSANSQTEGAKKSLTIGDLLMKPIQRVCKYPLLFAELLKYTPVVDCPQSHMDIENTLVRLREATAEINRATDDTRIKAVLEKTWILQDRLIFANQNFDAASKNRIRSFGHIQLCGVLHVCWQTKGGITGQYMVVLLYRDCMCLATAARTEQMYTIQACIAMHDIKVEEVDNGRGLQCHTAPYSWKLVFICDHQLHEMILTACTPKEEHEWRSRLVSPTVQDHQDKATAALFTSVSLNIKSMGLVFGKPGTVARRNSIHRATTVGPKTPFCHVILKNTSVIKDAPTPSTAAQINRSQSVLAGAGRVPVLAPSRSERARLEALLSDVWTRDTLPFPGITARSRSEHLVRAGASSVMRKLSVASIASSFTKRSTSAASLPGATTMAAGSTDGLGAEVGGSTATVNRSLLSAIPDENERRSREASVGGTWEHDEHDAAAASQAVAAAANETVVMDSEWGVDVLGTVPCLQSINVKAAADRSRSGSLADSTISLESGLMMQPTRMRPPPSVLRSVSDNSGHSSREMGVSGKRASFTPPVSHLVGRENVSEMGEEEVHRKKKVKASTSSDKSRKAPNRWATRVGGLHRETVVQGIRSIFR